MAAGLRTARIGVTGVVLAGLLLAGSPGPASADPDEISDAERASWTDEERRLHGEALWPELDVEEPVAATTELTKRPPVPTMPTGPAPADDLPAGTSESVEVVSDGQQVTAGPVTVDLADNASAVGAGQDLQVTVSVADPDSTAQAGVEGVLLEIVPSVELAEPVQVVIDYADYADVYGGDWASRLSLVSLPDCDPSAGQVCGQTEPVKSVNDPQARTMTATVAPESTGTMAMAASTSGSTGDWAATPLSPSATWDVSARTGDFTWSYPFRVPPAGSYPTPEVSLNYSSGSVDGRVASTNNQTSSVGEGWGLTEGFVERSYVPCTTDTTGGANNASHVSGDLCWGVENATVSLNGQAFELILDEATGKWRPRQDNGMRVELLTGATHSGEDGEHWRITTTDGIQYYFGRDRRPADNLALNSAWVVPVYGNHPGEPCYQASFASSACTQVWRWNLDYVVDTTGNSMTYVYGKETNRYGRNNNTANSVYARGGYLARIEYGQRAGSETTATAPAKVTFTVAERCLPSGTITCATTQLTAANASHWPDVPFDLICTSTTSCANVTSPAFFTRKRLVTVTTAVLSGSAYRNVDQWQLTQTFPSPGDGTSKNLWLSSIQHTGLAGSTAVAMPAVTFAGVQMANRVDQIGDLGPPMIRYRISSITTESGAITSINYSGHHCTSSNLPANPHTNDRRCIPVYWDPEGSTPMTLEYFHKYVVTSTIDSPGSGASEAIETNYTYLGDPAWHYTDNELIPAKFRTWSDFRGYGSVDVVVGNGGVSDKLRTRYEFFRGMHGDRATPTGGTRTVTIDGITDHDDYAGMTRTETVYDGSAVVSSTDNTPWRSAPTATNEDGRTARYTAIGTVEVTVTAPALSGGERTARTVTTFDAYGMPATVEDQGDLASSTDQKCTRYTYARNTGANILATVSRVETVAVACGVTPSRPGHVLSDVRTFYDSLTAHGAAPTKGLPTKVERVSGYSGSTPTYQTVTTSTYDATGRVLTVADALGRTTTTAYTPSTGGLASSIRVTSPDPDGAGPLTTHITTTAFDVAWGSQLKVTDPNGKITTGTYDALGRLTAVWQPGRVQGTDTANSTYSYKVATTGTNSVVTRTLMHDATQRVHVAYYDGLLRPRQTQEPTADRETAGRIVTDTVYDSRGLVAYENGPWYTTGSPSSTGVILSATAVPSRTEYVYDGAGRTTDVITLVSEQEVWRTTTSYGGDRTTTTPPTGGIPTTEIQDVFGRTTQLRQYPGATPTGSYDTVSYGYDAAGNRTEMTDAAGNDWFWEYDLRGRLTSQSDPDTGTTTYGYDSADQRTTSTDARNVTLFTAYDNVGRRTELRRTNATGTLLSAWTWDTLAEGQLTSSTRYDNGNAYTDAVTGYDHGYRPTGQTVTIPAAEGSLAGTYTYGYTYTVDGQLKTTSYPAVGGISAQTVTRFYDERNMLEWMNGGFNGGIFVAGSRYSVYGEPLLLDIGSHHANFINYAYATGTRRLEQMWAQREGQPTYDLDITYNYDDAGNILRIDDDAVGDTQCFTYTQAELAEAWTPTSGSCATTRSATSLAGPAPYWHSYTFDDAGSRTTLVDHKSSGNITTTYNRPAAGTDQAHTLTSTSTTGGATTSYTYDDAGNTLTRTTGNNTQTLTWDPEGRLDTFTDTTGTDEYVYNSGGDRLIRRQDGSTTLYLPNGQEVTRTGTTLTGVRSYSFAGLAIASRTANGSENLTSQISDHHGTPAIGINNATNAITRRYQDPYGNARGPQPLWTTDRGFLNKPTDSTGLTQVGARYYDASVGLFVSPDPLLLHNWPQQWHPYSYSNGNPTTLSDPSGLAPSNRMLHDGSGGGARGKSISSFAKPSPSVSAPSGGSSYTCGNLCPAHGQTAADRIREDAANAAAADGPPQLRGGPRALLDALTYFPVVGTPASAIQLGIYASEGDWENAGWAAAGLVPFGKALSKAGRWVVRLITGKPAAQAAANGVQGAAANATSAAAAASARSSFSMSTSQLTSKFKHAAAFGVDGAPNAQSLAGWRQALTQHVNSPNTVVIEGVYHGQPAIHFVDPSTGLNAFTHPDGSFWSAWQLSPAQLEHVLESGKL